MTYRGRSEQLGRARRALLVSTFAAAAALGTAALLGGCAEAGAAAGAVATADTAVKTAALAAEAIPAAIQAMADSLVTDRKLNWGKPNRIIVTRDYYVFLYPTPDSERKKKGVRRVVVERTSYVARLQRLQRGEL